MPEAPRRELTFVLLATLLCLVPFVGKPFNIDEPLFIWVAKHLQANPFDFYGFTINWYGTESGAAEVIKNPPLASYYLALAGGLFGWSETALHLAFLVPALAAAVGTYFLAREMSQLPVIATLFSLFTPVFVVSGATVMCDTMMVAFYVWAVHLWIRGLACDSRGKLVGASLLAALCALTKYFGMSLIPLLFAYTIIKKRGKGKELLFLLIPLLILAGYQWWTARLYGRGLLFDAAAYAGAARGNGGRAPLLSGFVEGLSFAGGCFLPLLLLLPRIWGKRVLLAFAAAVPVLALIFSQLPVPRHPDVLPWGYYLQLGLYVATGFLLLALALRDLRTERDEEALLLFLWIVGTFLFAAVINWTVNGRSILPMAPAVGILLARALGKSAMGGEETAVLRSKAVVVWCVLAFSVSMAVAWSDFVLADTARTAAQVVTRNFKRSGTSFLYQGHWGFQYYMDLLGAEAWDGRKDYKKPVVMTVPVNNTNTSARIMSQGELMQVLELPTVRYLSTTNPGLRASFYSSLRGPLPFAFGPAMDERYYVLLFR